MCQSLGCVQLFETPMDCSLPGTSGHGILSNSVQEFLSRHEYWSGLPFPSPGDQTQVSCIAGRFFIIWATKGKDYLVPALNIEGVRNTSLRQSTALQNEPGTWKKSNYQINFNAHPQTLHASVALRLLCWDLTRADSKKFLWSHLIYFWEHVGEMLIQLWENKPSGREFMLCARRNS